MNSIVMEKKKHFPRNKSYTTIVIREKQSYVPI